LQDLKKIINKLKKISLAFIVIIIDQLSKYLIKSNFSLYETTGIIGSILKFTYIENSGLAFGLPVGSLSWLLFLITLLITIYILIIILTEKINQRYEHIALNFILGGAIGNLIDRGLTLFDLYGYKGVIDFIDMGIGSYRWYVFNIADLSVSIGIGIYIFCSYFCSIDNQLEHENA